jgi:hypothetical protein
VKRPATAPSPTAAKRAHTDENSALTPAVTSSGHKRAKSGLSGALHAVLKSAVTSTPKKKRGFGFDVTNIRPNTRGAAAKDKSASGKPAFGKPARTIVKSHSPKRSSPKAPSQVSPSRRAGSRARARAPSSPSPRSGSGRGIRRPVFKRVDPPSFNRDENSSIDSLLARFSHPTPKISVTPASSEVPREEAPLLATNIPDSWIFDIYEDSPEETLQNLMEHSTCTLEISDDSEDEPATSELQEKGQENIAPARLAELLAVAPAERGDAMRVDTPAKAIPQRRAPGGGPGGRVLREHREALREMQKEELIVPSPVVEGKGVGLPSGSSSSELKRKQEEEPEEGYLAATPKSPESPGFVVWESDHEDDDEDEAQAQEDEVGVAAAIPLPISELDVDYEDDLDGELAEQGFRIFGSDDAASLGEVSDKEN